MNDKLNDALNEVEEEYIAEAAEYRRKRRPYWIGAVAAALAVVLLVSGIGPGAQEPAPTTKPMLQVPTTAPAKAEPIITTAPAEVPDITSPAPSIPAPTIALLSGQVAAPSYPAMVPYPQFVSGQGFDDSAWQANRKEQYDQPEGYADTLTGYFLESIPLFLSCSTENTACSPLNIYMALAMLAETSGGSSRQQILDALNADSIEALRTQAGHVWNAHYCADGATTSLLANSLWLDDSISCTQSTADLLADAYYASVFHSDLQSDDTLNAMAAWLERQSGGLLTQYTQQTTLSPEAAIHLATTVCYGVKWENEFPEKDNAQGPFHAPGGDVTATFMHDTTLYNTYFWGSNFSAAYLNLNDSDDTPAFSDSSKMWFILPDAGETPQSVLESGDALGMVLDPDSWADQTAIKINYAVPKFDLSCQTELTDSLQQLGIRDVFHPYTADLSPITAGEVWLDTVRHSVRVAIDEEGVTAAAYTEMSLPGRPAPPEDEVDFVLDRPFIFVITSRDGLPMFAGVVNHP